MLLDVEDEDVQSSSFTEYFCVALSLEAARKLSMPNTSVGAFNEWDLKDDSSSDKLWVAVPIGGFSGVTMLLVVLRVGDASMDACSTQSDVSMSVVVGEVGCLLG